jgi:NAD(P)H-nitrite reductase large subunit
MKVGIIGAGHAGVTAARAAREAGAEVVLFSAETACPYFRPRLVALAFGQAEVDAILIHPRTWYAEQGIDLKLQSRVDTVDPVARCVNSHGRAWTFDALVVATGAAPILPAFATGAPDTVLPLWSVKHAQNVRARCRPGAKVMVIGGGILGIETALRAVEAGMTAVIVEKLDRLMPRQFGARASKVIVNRLNEKGIAVMLGTTVCGVEQPPGDSRAVLRLDNGRGVSADFCIVSIGVKPDTGGATAARLNVGWGIRVDAHLRTSAECVFAAGDVIELAGVTRCSVGEATRQGRVAGSNAARALSAGELEGYTPASQPLTFKSRDFEVYAIGTTFGEGTEEICLEGSTESVLRSLVVKDGIAMGVQMIGTREGFEEYGSKLGERVNGSAPLAE